MKISFVLFSNIFIIFYLNKSYNFTFCEEVEDLEVVEDSEELPDVSVEPEAPKDLSEEELLDSADDSKVLTSEKLFKDSSKSEKYEYQAEVTRLLDIIVNSLYSSKDIFLRELVSNSADALEKYKITSLQKNYKDKDEVDLFVRIRSYPKKRLLTIWDNGVGMTKSDLMNNLGTIAKSGTANFLDSLSKVGNDPNLIGQFGVGFYSAFLVADTVLVQTKHYEDKQYVWRSSAANSYELYEDTDNSLGDHGTLITLELREDATEYLKTDVLEGLVKKYSQFVKYPIQLYKKLKDQNEVGWVNVNQTQQIWTRNKNSITEEEYTDFYRSISGKTDTPLAHVHFTAEGDVDFKALLYIPSSPPAMYFNNDSVNHNVKLYSRRVLVSEHLRDFIPRYLFSVYGVVDSDSFPLNVSREYLQQSKLEKKSSSRKHEKIKYSEPEYESNDDNKTEKPSDPPITRSIRHTNFFEKEEKEAEEFHNKRREHLIKSGHYIYNSDIKGPKKVNVFVDDENIKVTPDFKKQVTPWYMKPKTDVIYYSDNILNNKSINKNKLSSESENKRYKKTKEELKNERLSRESLERERALELLKHK